MRLKVTVALANENLIALINRGYAILDAIEQDYTEKKDTKIYNEDIDNPKYGEQMNQWADEVINGLTSIFPTEFEKNLFSNPEIPFGAVSGDYKYQSMVRGFEHFIRGLEKIRQSSLSQYTDLPLQDRLYVEDIDSFQDTLLGLVGSFARFV